MKKDGIEVFIQVLAEGRWRRAVEFEQSGRTFIEGAHGQHYRIIVSSSLKAERKAVGCWVDGVKAVIECLWLEAGGSTIVKGFSKGASSATTSQPVPFVFSKVISGFTGSASCGAGTADRTEAVGTIAVALYRPVPTTAPYEARYEPPPAFIRELSPAAVDSVVLPVTEKAIVHKSLATALPVLLREEANANTSVATVTWKLDLNQPLAFHFRYCDAAQLRVLGVTTAAQGSPSRVVFIPGSAPSPVSSTSSFVSGSKRSRPSTVEVVDLLEDEERTLPFHRISISPNDGSFRSVDICTPATLSGCSALRSDMDPRLVEFFARCKEALKMPGVPVTSLCIWSLDGAQLGSFEALMEHPTVVVGRSSENFIPLPNLAQDESTDDGSASAPHKYSG
jgi:hypothetical protein